MQNHRSWHFIPAHRADYLERSAGMPADVLIFDLEDGVPAAEKQNARRNLQRLLHRGSALDRGRCFLRVNADEASFRSDLRLLRRTAFGGVVLPKVDDARTLRSRMRALARACPRGGRIALIESFKALAGLPAILDAWPLSGVGLGLEDMFSEIDLPESEVPDLVKHVKLRLIVEAKARGLVCIDSVSLEYRSRARLARLCARSRSLGFDGMFDIHPDQIRPINAAFAPRREDILWARKIARLSSMKDDSGYLVKGRDVVSPPKVRKARWILGRVGAKGSR